LRLAPAKPLRFQTTLIALPFAAHPAMFGRPDAAAAARLFIAAAGAAADLDEAEPVFAAIGQKVFRIGDKPRGTSRGSSITMCPSVMLCMKSLRLAQ
jgi:3-hydroxyisobutyrate dehydrogenase-like beta-hydroxyacid dehydrogenase